jgi:hypothetical protein
MKLDRIIVDRVRRYLTLGAFSAVLVLGAGYALRAAPKAHWVVFKSNVLNLQVSVPSDWKPVKTPNALAFRYEGLDGAKAGIGILKSSQTSGTIESAAETEFTRAGHPSAWTRTAARVDGMRAVKIVGTDTANASIKFVHYYIDAPQGMYLVQCQAPTDQWSTYSPIFAAVLARVKFLQ